MSDAQEDFEDFLKNFQNNAEEFVYRQELNRLSIYDLRSMTIDLDDLLDFGDGSLGRTVLEKPEASIEAASSAVKAVMKTEDACFAKRAGHFFARFRNLPPAAQVRIADLRARHLNQIVGVKGIISRVSPVRPKVTKAVFRCKACGEEITILQDEPVFRRPKNCPNLVDCPSKRGPFQLISEDSEFVDWQKATLQDSPEDLQPGQLPQSLDIIMVDDLVGAVRPGDRATCVGIFRGIPDTRKPRGAHAREFLTFLSTNHLDIEGRDLEAVMWSPTDEALITAAVRQPDWEDTLLACVAPELMGLEHAKAAVLASLLGGHPFGARRGDIHLLLIGDPGVGKSILLKYAALLATRAVLTTGKGTTAAGLTAAVVADTVAGGYTLEAGALVLADRGVACIDELDKMSSTDRSALHEAMEQQVVSIAKAGINATLNARTTIIAAANPKSGRFDRDKVPSENIKLPASLLSRFDLIFTMLDKPDQSLDAEITAHVLADARAANGTHAEPPLPRQFVRKFVSLARHRCHPALSAEAAARVESHYLAVRRQGQAPESPMPITTRQLEGLVRLSQARAKMFLRNEVSEEDVEWAWQLLYRSLCDIGQESESGAIDIDAIETGVPRSTRTASATVLEIMRELQVEHDNRIPRDAIIEAAEARGLSKKKAKHALTYLSREGLVFKPVRAERNYGIVGGAAQ